MRQVSVGAVRADRAGRGRAPAAGGAAGGAGERTLPRRRGGGLVPCGEAPEGGCTARASSGAVGGREGARRGAGAAGPLLRRGRVGRALARDGRRVRPPLLRAAASLPPSRLCRPLHAGGHRPAAEGRDRSRRAGVQSRASEAVRRHLLACGAGGAARERRSELCALDSSLEHLSLW